MNKNKAFQISVLIIIVVALFFRTFNYTNRLYLESDNTRDVQVAKYAADHFQIPTIGQFSSAGPFFYGPWYYIFLEITSFFPLGKFTQWYFSLVLSLSFVYFMYVLGKEVKNKYLGLISALFSAISPAVINNSLSVWNPSIVPFLSLISILFLIKSVKYQQNKYVFLTAFFVGLALTIHFQSILILPIILIAFIFIKPSLKKFLLLIFGFCLPFLPLIIFDLKFNFFNFRNIYQYLTVGQYNIWVPNRWLTYIFNYWPDAWSLIIGGNKVIFWIITIILGIMIFLNLIKRKLNKPTLALLLVFILEIILYRYYRGERYGYYSYFAQPLILFFTAWMIYELIKFNKFLGIILITIICFFTIKSINLNTPKLTYPVLQKTINEIYSVYPNDKFSIYGCLFNGNTVAHPIAYFLYLDHKNDTQGIKIGVCETEKIPVSWIKLNNEEVGKPNSAWINKDTKQVFEETVLWWKTNPPN